MKSLVIEDNVEEELNIETRNVNISIHQNNVSKLNLEQKKIYDDVMLGIESASVSQIGYVKIFRIVL